MCVTALCEIEKGSECDLRAAVGDAEKDQAIAGAMAFGDGRGDLVNGGVNIIGADGFGRSHGLIEAARAKPVTPDSGASRVISRSYGTS